MHQLAEHLTPNGYTNLYQACINAGWTEDQLDRRLTEVEPQAQAAGYIAATLKGLVHDGPPVAAASHRSTAAAATGPHTVVTARIHGQPQMGRRIQPHPYAGDEQDCHHCQLPRTNTAHQAH